MTAFKQSDVERAIKAVEKRGYRVGAVEHKPDGTVRILTLEAVAANAEPQEAPNPWDEVLAGAA